LYNIKLLDLELAGGCNYSCQMCPQSDELGREKEFKKLLKFPVFKKIVDDAIDHGVEVVTLHGGGEPTLHKQFIDCIKYVKDKGLICKTFTNGKRINRELADQIAESEIDLVRFSVIGYNRDTYREWMREDAFEEVRENARYLVEACKNTNTEVHSNHLVIDANNVEYEVGQYIENWVNVTNTLSEVWLMHNWSGTYDGPYQRHKDNRRTCGRPFHPTLQVRAGGLDKHNGAVVACCMVLGRDSEATLGHLDTQSIEEVLNDVPYTELRNAHNEKRFDDISYCKDCDQLYDVPESLVWTNIEGRKYNQSKGLHGILTGDDIIFKE
jgi:MoaA/NifB/PqqE/SkfB family radical SAM enzyme